MMSLMVSLMAHRQAALLDHMGSEALLGRKESTEAQNMGMI